MGRLCFVSRDLIPLTRKSPAKLHDSGLQRMVHAGLGLWNPNAGRLMALPLGTAALDALAQLVLTTLEEAGLEPRAVFSGSERGPLEFALRMLKRPDDLPRLFLERRGDEIILQGFASDPEEARAMANDTLRALGRKITALGLAVRRVERTAEIGPAFDLACQSEKPLDGETGFVDPSGALLAPDSPLAAPSWKGDDAPLEDVATPNCDTIDALASFLSVAPRATLKSMAYQLDDGRFVLALCRGDRSISARKLTAAFKGAAYHPATHEELIAALGDVAGYIGPLTAPENVALLADCSVVDCCGAVAGAGKPGYHTRGVAWGRDFSTQWIADITAVQSGDETAQGALTPASWRTLARLYPLDSRLLDASLTVGGRGGKSPITPWSGSLNLTALAAGLAEAGQMKHLISFQLFLVDDGSQLRAQVVQSLTEAGLDVLEDDRSLPAQVRWDDGQSLAVPRLLLANDGTMKLAGADGEEQITEIPELLNRLAAL